MDGHFRRTARHEIELTVRFRRDASDSALEQSGRVIDLGLGGAQIRCERPPPIGTKLSLSMRAASAWDPLELSGIVRWIDESAGEGAVFGVAFEALSPSGAAALFELMDAHRFSERTE